MPPPTRAKSAMDEAPMAKPLMMTGSCQRRRKMPRPRRPSEAMVRPITEPPKKATASALSRPTVRAACAVRTLALVAAFMPMKPASMEQTAPEMKASAVRGPMPRESRTGARTGRDTAAILDAAGVASFAQPDRRGALLEAGRLDRRELVG